MNPTQLHRQSAKILEQIAKIGPMRKGSVTQQFVKTKGKDGEAGLRGPYPLYSRKRNGKTISKRIPTDRVDSYQEQIGRFRQFEKLIGELVEVAEEMAEAEVAQKAAKKKGSTI